MAIEDISYSLNYVSAPRAEQGLHGSFPLRSKVCISSCHVQNKFADFATQMNKNYSPDKREKSIWMWYFW